MEVKSSMGVIVAAPTAGSAGACPGAVLAVADALGKSEEETAQVGGQPPGFERGPVSVMWY
eukprot:m.415423 g.415423  ORF g.415423 m.415423 type:complete len:61 (+) comp21276_c0_seq35:1698-1880(+)